MSLFVYVLRCSDDSVYVGRTDDLEKRIADHRARRYSGYTAKRLPAELIFWGEFATPDEGFTAERQIKGWRRSKKLALARRDWDSRCRIGCGTLTRTSSGRGRSAHDTSTSP